MYLLIGHETWIRELVKVRPRFDNIMADIRVNNSPLDNILYPHKPHLVVLVSPILGAREPILWADLFCRFCHGRILSDFVNDMWWKGAIFVKVLKHNTWKKTIVSYNINIDYSAPFGYPTICLTN
jgi:hypothetical protein